MDITINTPALLFPAISLILLAYTNRFLALANVVRALHDRYKDPDGKVNASIHAQIQNLRYRIRLIKNMQIMGVSSILLAMISMYLMYINNMPLARYSFAASLISFMISLVFSLIELFQSTKSLEIELSDTENESSQD